MSFVSSVSLFQRPFVRAKKLEATFPALHIDSLSRPSEFVSHHGTDLCVGCRADTGVPSHQHVSERRHYVEGVGQYCRHCF
jgi:hypothetical protein